MQASDKIDSLQSLRLFASLGVFQYHLWDNYLQVQFGHPGTDFFLVLVGIVTALTQTRRIQTGRWGNYMLSRIVRIYVTFVPLFLLTLAVKWDEASWDWIWRSFLFLPIPDRLPLIGCTWMLANFMLFYTVFSVAFLFRREDFLIPVFTIWAVGIVAYSWFDWNLGLPSSWAGLFLDSRNLEMLFGYLAGIALRSNLLSIIRGRLLLWTGLFGVITGTILLNNGEETIFRPLYLGLPVAMFCLGAAVLERGKSPDFLVRFLSWSGLVWLGGASYVLYLSHGAFLQLWSWFLPITPSIVPVIILGAIGVAIAGMTYWEIPMLKRAKTVLHLY